jgi:hypothetical protein
MAKKRGKAEGAEGGEELIIGVPLRQAQEFLCGHEYSEWFDFEFGARRLARDQDEPERSRTLQRITREMLARGWIEKVASRAAAQRYKLTEAGRRYAAESRHLFKWPAAQSRIRPAPRYAGRLRCLTHLHNELLRLKLNERDLSEVQRSFLGDLEGGFDEEALAAMHDWWNYNHEVICVRGNYVVGGYGRRPASPRIDITVFLTSKDNLIVEWCPSGMKFDRLTPECDWVRWRAERNRRVNWDSRPSNELLFIHEVRHAAGEFTGRYMYDPKFDPPERFMIDSILLQTAAAMVEELQERLKLSFEVRMVTNIFMEWEEIEAKHWPGGKAKVLTSWTIENVDERNRKANLKSSLEEIERFPEQYGCPLDVFVKALIEPDAKKATGPAPVPHTKHDRVSRQLKKAGYTKITLGVVQHYHALLQKHRPELFAPAPAGPTEQTTTAVPADDKIVPFRKPNGSDGPTNGGPSAA